MAQNRTRAYSKETGKTNPMGSGRMDPQERQDGEFQRFRAQARLATLAATGRVPFTAPDETGASGQNTLNSNTPGAALEQGQGCGPGTYLDPVSGVCLELPPAGGDEQTETTEPTPWPYIVVAVIAARFLG